MEDIIVTTKQGRLRGKREKDMWGAPFIGFMGIPYAKPPVGKLRFKDPLPPEEWNGIRDATREGEPSFSPSPPISPEKITGSEDCLFLNVYTHQLLKRSNDQLQPVMVFIHGGSFTTGSGNRGLLGPEFLLSEDIVLVTINYRLGALGFLSIEDASLEVPGNAGLKDQILALKWVQNNITQFMGDPDNVTIFGESAGGTSVHYLVLSPLAKGLFHKAILQSGTVFCPFSCGENNAQKLAKVLGYDGTDNEGILEFLQQVPAEKIIEGQIELGDWLTVSRKRHFGPCIEKKSQNALITEEPINLISSGNYNQVPLIIGYTSREGMLVEGNEDLGIVISKTEFVPHMVGHQLSQAQFEELNKKLIKFYFGKEQVDENNKDAVYLAITDAFCLRGIYLTVKAHAKTSSQPIYYYRMSVSSNLNAFKNLFGIKNKGVSHGDDLGYLFKMMGNPTLKPKSIENIYIKRFVKMWTNFARTGNPTSSKDSYVEVEWKAVKGTELNFLDIGEKLTTDVNPDIDRMNFWDEIFKDITENYLM